MDVDQCEKLKRWVANFLIPNLIENQRLFDCKLSIDCIKVKKIEVTKLSLGETFMISECFFVNFLIKIGSVQNICDTENGADENEFNFFIKLSPDFDAEFYKGAGVEEKYTTEILAYEQIIPKLKSLSNSPRFFYSHNKFQDATIVISNFAKDGWQMSKSKVNLSLDHTLTAVKLLGEFHGEMYAMKLFDTDTFNAIKVQIPAPKKSDGSAFELDLFRALGIRRATLSVRTSKIAKNIVPEAFLKQLEDIMLDVNGFIAKCKQPIEPYAIICHGDYLRNNIAFRYDDDGNAVETMMFDFQTVCYASPMIDLCTFITNSTGHQLRHKHFSTIFNAYHDSLIQTVVASMNCKENEIPDFLRYDHFLIEYARYLPFGLFVASSFLRVLHSKEPINVPLTLIELVESMFDCGGEAVDVELRSLIMEIYRLYEKLNLKLETNCHLASDHQFNK